MTFTEATRDYEAWMAGVIPAPLDGQDLDYKHRLLADPADPFPFFRGTYYRWVQCWIEAAGPLAAAPRVLAVGDLHVENYGTWRDTEGRLCWGVNDFDEVDELPYTNDLVRLAASLRFVKRAGVLEMKTRDACGAILDGYRECLAGGGKPFVLEEHHPHLRAMAMAVERDPVKFWGKLRKLLDDPAADPPADALEALAATLPTTGLKVQYRTRPRIGVGSLGRPRYVALSDWAGGWVCREAKALAPPATAWVTGVATPCRAGEAVRRAIRAPDPYYHPGQRWVVRRLGPRSSRVNLSELTAANAERVLQAMGAEAANVHLGTAGAAVAIQADLAGRPAEWLADAARTLCRLLEADWALWRSERPAGQPLPAGATNESKGQ